MGRAVLLLLVLIGFQVVAAPAEEAAGAPGAPAPAGEKAEEKGAGEKAAEKKPEEKAADGKAEKKEAGKAEEKAKEKAADGEEAAAAAPRPVAFAELFRGIGFAFGLRPPVDAEVKPEMLVQQYEAEFRRQFRPLVSVELRFIEVVCKPTAEERKSLKAAGDAALKRAVKQLAELQAKLETGRFQGREAPGWPNPRKLVIDELSKSVQSILPGDRAKPYADELEKRAAARKRAALAQVVSRLDSELLLSPEQRAKLSDLFISKWQPQWTENLEVLLRGEGFLPSLPDDQVLPILTEPQKQVWNAMQKNPNGFSGWSGFGIFQPNELEPDEEEEAPPEEKR